MIPAIDVHAHYGLAVGHGNALRDEFMTGDADVVLARAQSANIAITFCSPLRGLMPVGNNDPVAANEDARRTIGGRKGLRYWVLVDPLRPATFDQAHELLSDPWCVGMKIHPEVDGYRIAEHGRALFALAARHNAVIQSHSGEPKSLPQDFVPFADEFPGVAVILSHLGFSHDGDPTRQVRAIQAGRNGNIYTDSSSAQSIMPNLIEWAVRKVGAERILFGTDTPLYFSPMQRARIEYAEIPAAARRLILAGNAERLFGPRLGAAPLASGSMKPNRVSEMALGLESKAIEIQKEVVGMKSR